METSSTPGLVTGFLVRNSNDSTITRYDVNFTNPAVLKDGTSEIATFVDPGGNAPDGVSLFLVDGVLYSYAHDLASTTLKTMHTFPSGSRFDSLTGEDFACNLTHCFFVEVNKTTAVQTLNRAAIDGTGSAPMGAAFANDNIQRLVTTSSRLYLGTAPKVGSGQSLYAIDQSGGSFASVDSIAIGYFDEMIDADTYLYYKVIDESAGMTVSAKVLKDDNTVAVGTIANAGWVGLVVSSIQLNTRFDPWRLYWRKMWPGRQKLGLRPITQQPQRSVLLSAGLMVHSLCRFPLLWSVRICTVLVTL